MKNTTAPLVFALSLLLAPTEAMAGIVFVELAPSDVGSSSASTFSTLPTLGPTLYLGSDLIGDFRSVNFNTAPDGPLAEGGVVSNQYESLGVLANNVRISNSIFGGNNYGAGFAVEHDLPQIYTFSTPVIAAGIINTSPDADLIEFFSGANATGTFLGSFSDQGNSSIDRFVGGIADEGTTIGSIRISNQTGNLELDELIFVQSIPEPSTALLMFGIGIAASVRRRRSPIYT